MTRTKKSIKNIKYALVGQVSALLITFVSRTVFVKILGEEYLGVNSLFTNILTMLSFAELGIGAAITYSLYSPLANNETEQIKSIMLLFKKVYKYIGVIILILSVLLIPFLDNIAKDGYDVNGVYLIYFLFVINSVVSYFYNYKRSLIIADQNRYIATIYRYAFFNITSIIQIALLIVFKNYILFLIIQVVMTILENILISKKADQMYPYLKDNNVKKLDKVTLSEIIKNTKAMFGHKIGGIIVNSTDNLLISKISGIATVGLYSNYLLIVGSLNTVFSILFQSVMSSIGNLGVSSSYEKKNEIFNIVNLVCFVIYGFTSVLLLLFLNPFIKLWIGEKFLLENSVLWIIIINFYITGMRKSVLTFRDALGLFWHDRFKPIFEVLFNLTFSIILGLKFGIFGILLGTTLSTLFVCCWVEPYILFKYGLKSELKKYFLIYFYQIFVLLIIITISINLISLNFVPNFYLFDLLIKFLLISIICFGGIIISHIKTSEIRKLFKILIKGS